MGKALASGRPTGQIHRPPTTGLGATPPLRKIAGAPFVKPSGSSTMGSVMTVRVRGLATTVGMARTRPSVGEPPGR